MGFLSGPSKERIVGMARGVAGFAMQLHVLDSLDQGARESIIAGMKAEGAPTSVSQLTRAAANVVRGEKMGTWKKSQFLGVIQAECLLAGMSKTDAANLIQMIDIQSK